MRRGTRKSTAGAEDLLNSVGNFSTRFSLPSFVKRVEKLTDNQKDVIKKMGFGSLLLLPNHMLSKNLLVELMERWSCENCAFLLPPGKIEITVMDVVFILGLPVVGSPVVLQEDAPLLDLEKEFGALLSKRKIAVSDLETKMDSLGEVVSDEFIRAFLLFTIGTLLFPNASGKVDSRYLYLLRNLDDVSQFAWGAAVLEEMIMWLNKRKEMRVQYIGGCLIFLQIWSYEHIDIARPDLLSTDFIFPRACRWENSKSHQRQWVIAKFQELQGHQITWKLQPTSAELEVSAVKELLEAENDGRELSKSRSSSIDVSLDVSVVEIDSDSNIAIEVEDEQNVILEQMKAPVIFSESKTSEKNAEQALGLQNALANPTHSNEDMGAGYQILEELNMELMEEIDKLRSENGLLRDQLSSAEEQIVMLKKEAEDLRRKKTSTDNLAVRLENIVFEL